VVVAVTAAGDVELDAPAAPAEAAPPAWFSGTAAPALFVTGAGRAPWPDLAAPRGTDAMPGAPRAGPAAAPAARPPAAPVPAWPELGRSPGMAAAPVGDP